MKESKAVIRATLEEDYVNKDLSVCRRQSINSLDAIDLKMPISAFKKNFIIIHVVSGTLHLVDQY